MHGTRKLAPAALPVSLVIFYFVFCISTVCGALRLHRLSGLFSAFPPHPPFYPPTMGGELFLPFRIMAIGDKPVLDGLP